LAWDESKEEKEEDDGDDDDDDDPFVSSSFAMADHDDARHRQDRVARSSENVPMTFIYAQGVRLWMSDWNNRMMPGIAVVLCMQDIDVKLRFYPDSTIFFCLALYYV
jgi:hypothetical protein